MINLLSTERKRELTAARRNVILRKYVFTLIFLAIVITGSFLVGFGLLHTRESEYKKEIARYKPEQARYADTLEQAGEYNNNLRIAKSILDNDMSFSSLTMLIARTTPKNVTLVTLNIHAKELAKPIELTFGAKSHQDTLVAKEAFENSPYFKDVKLRSIDKQGEGDYPYRFVLLVTFERDIFTKAEKEGRL